MSSMTLPFDPPFEPMLAKLSATIPEGDGWLYEPKWDGFRALVFFDGSEAHVQSRDLKPLARYFPELKASLERVLPSPMVLDGEVVIMTDHGLDFDLLQMRIHPAESRVKKLAAETPSSFVAFDMLADSSDDLRARPFAERRSRLVERLSDVGPPVFLTPATADIATAGDWFEQFEGAGLDGIVAKRLDGAYQPGVRAMAKIKHLRTADCVVAGLRWYKGEHERAIGSLLLGLYDDDGVLHHVGHTSSFKADEKRRLADELRPHISDDEGEGYGGGRMPGSPSRWTGAKDLSWVRLRPERVCEVTFDHLQGNRFRHAATFKRWRTDKQPSACTFEQIEETPAYDLVKIFGRSG
jgi:ATP-dependent DNA ligase